MKTYTLTELLLENRPEQFVLLEKLVALFKQSPALSQVFVRGSIAKNNFDRVSDLDLVLSFDAKAYQDVIESLDTLMSHNFHTLFPGWNDSIVADFGGLGFVYLVEHEGKLYQIDIYVIPSNRAERLPTLTKAKLVYARELMSVNSASEIIAADRFIANYRRSPRGPQHLLIEAIIVSSLIQKRIKRNQMFLNYSETHLLNSSIRNFLRSVFDPEFVEYGWYHIEDNFSRNPARKKWLEFLRDLIQGPTTHSTVSLRATMTRFKELVHEVTPKLEEQHEESLDLFYRKSDFL